MHINLLDPPVSAPLEPVASEPLKPVAGELFQRACWLSGLKETAAAAYMRITPQQLSQQIGGNGHLSLARMLNLPLAFWSVLAALVLQRKGMDFAQSLAALAVGRSHVASATVLSTLDQQVR